MTIRINVRFRKDRGYYEMYYTDKATGRRVVKSAETADWKAAERAAALWKAEIESGRAQKALGWDAFRRRFEDEYQGGQGANTRSSYDSALNHFENLYGKPVDMNSITGSVISEFTKKLRDQKLGEERVAGVLRVIRLALRFAVRIGVMRECPPLKLPKTVKRKLWRSRAITETEFEKLLQHVEGVVGVEHAPGWQRLLRGLWWSGLRISEALELSWDMPPIRVALDGPAKPRLIIFGEGQKSREDEVLPITPDFARFLQETPEDQRHGKVFPLTHAEWAITRTNVSREIGSMGRAANIVVDAKGKCVSAHDLRRVFGHRWALRVAPLILQRLMRHKTLQTTMRYYVEIQDGDVANAIWLPGW